MKKLTTFIVLLFAIAETQAQSYQITFAGSGASTTVDSVKVQNITQCTDTSLGGSDILNLVATVGISELNAATDNTLNIYPNPMTGACTLDFIATVQGKATLELYDIAGKRILQEQELLSKGHHAYFLSGIGSGIYLLKVSSDNYSYATKIVSLNPTLGKAEISPTGTLQNSDNHVNVGSTKNVKSTIDMQFNAGDTLKLTGKSGIYHTVMMLIPTSTQTLTFNFVDCTDANGNHYSVVQIGMQLWMAEDLKATKYRNLTDIPNIPDSATWRNTTTGAYCNYHNDPAEGAKYGHLYNWYAGVDVQNIAPVGWHTPSDSEWTILSVFMGGDSISGQMMKENCNTRWAYLDTTWGKNAFGFTALCTNFRVGTGAWSMAPNNDHDSFFWTTTTGLGPTLACANGPRWCYRNLFRGHGFIPKTQGCSIRCVHD